MPITFDQKSVQTQRHTTAYLQAGPSDGPLMIFLHGWPELSILWRAQLEHFSAAGWRCIAPDMRGYGGSAVHDRVSGYAVAEIVADMLELHDALGGQPAVWVGHDWGGPIAWAISSHHPDRCRAVVSLCIPYLPGGFTLPSLTVLVDRGRYPVDRFPVGQWDYWLYHREQPEESARDLGKDVRATLTWGYRVTPPRPETDPAPFAQTRANQGWFGPDHQAPELPRDRDFIGDDDFELAVSAFERTGFRGADAWYLNDALNETYAAQAPNFGRIPLPTLFVHAANDSIATTLIGRLSEPMREHCSDLTEVTIESGHFVQVERPGETNRAIADWFASRGIG